MCSYSSATSGGMSSPTMRCDGIVSRVALPDLYTASTLLNVSSPSGANRVPPPGRRGTAASVGVRIRPPGKRPPVSVISAAFAPPA